MSIITYLAKGSVHRVNLQSLAAHRGCIAPFLCLPFNSWNLGGPPPSALHGNLHSHANEQLIVKMISADTISKNEFDQHLAQYPSVIGATSASKPGMLILLK